MNLSNFILSTLHKHEEPARAEEHLLPFCPRKALIAKLYPSEKSHSFQNRYNYAVSKALKNLVQRTWSQQGLLWGDWRCSDVENCGIILRGQILQRCPRCHGELSYIKPEVTDPITGFKVKADGVVLCEEARGFVPYIISCRNAKIINQRKGMEPYESEQASLAFVAHGLSRKVQIAGRLIVWLNKGNATPFLHWFYRDKGEDIYRVQVAAWQAYQEKEGTCEGNLTKLPAVCADRCPHKDLCFSKEQGAIEARYQEVFHGRGSKTD